MNFTYYFYCQDEECGFRHTAHQYGEEVTLQCTRCFSIEAKSIEHAYYFVCVACGEKEIVNGDVSFDPYRLETCRGCGLSGEIGFEKGADVLLVLGTDMKPTTSCSACKKDEWQELIDAAFTCPYCFKPLKQKMSMLWEEKETGKE